MVTEILVLTIHVVVVSISEVVAALVNQALDRDDLCVTDSIGHVLTGHELPLNFRNESLEAPSHP